MIGAKTLAIAERVMPEIQNIVSSMSSAGDRDTEYGMPSDSQGVREDTNGFIAKIINRFVGLQLI